MLALSRRGRFGTVPRLAYSRVNICVVGAQTLGAAVLADALSATTTLRSLNVRDNRLGEVGVEALSKGMLRNSSITQLKCVPLCDCVTV